MLSPSYHSLEVLGHPWIITIAGILYFLRIFRRQNPLGRFGLGRRSHRHPADRRRVARHPGARPFHPDFRRAPRPAGRRHQPRHAHRESVIAPGREQFAGAIFEYRTERGRRRRRLRRPRAHPLQPGPGALAFRARHRRVSLLRAENSALDESKDLARADKIERPRRSAPALDAADRPPRPPGARSSASKTCWEKRSPGPCPASAGGAGGFRRIFSARSSPRTKSRTRLSFVAKKSGRGFCQTIDLEGSTIAHEPQFLSENLVIVPADWSRPEILLHVYALARRAGRANRGIFAATFELTARSRSSHLRPNQSRTFDQGLCCHPERRAAKSRDRRIEVGPLACRNANCRCEVPQRLRASG